MSFTKVKILILLIPLLSYGCNDTGVGSSKKELEKRSYKYSEIVSAGTFSNKETFDKSLQDSLTRVIDYVLKFVNVRDISVAVGVPGKGIWTATRQAGNNSTSIDSSTVFHAESTGKIFTSAVILKLIEQGILSLDMTIDKWYPSIPGSNKITIRHLLTHTSGIPTFEIQKEYIPQKYYEPIEKVNFSIKYAYLFQPGEGFSYSNTGYIILGLIAEQATGKSFADLLKDLIINPLGLKNTFPITEENKDYIIKIPGYKHGAIIEYHEDYTGPASAGMIATTPTDIIIFLQALMSGKLLFPQSVEGMFTDMIRFPDIQNPAFYGKGIMALPDIPKSEFPIDFAIEHNGGSGDMGFFSYPLYIPKANIFVSVMVNDDDQNAAGIKWVLANCIVVNLKSQ